MTGKPFLKGIGLERERQREEGGVLEMGKLQKKVKTIKIKKKKKRGQSRGKLLVSRQLSQSCDRQGFALLLP